MSVKIGVMRWWVVVQAACVAGNAVWASTFVLMDERALARRSVSVVEGIVRAVAVQAVDGRFSTYVAIDRVKVLAGADPGERFVLREPGGSIGGVTQRVPGSPDYFRGEHVVAFLSQNADGTLRTTGMAMGKYTVSASPDGSILLRRAIGPEVVTLDPATGQPVESDEGPLHLANLEILLRGVELSGWRTNVVPIPEEYGSGWPDESGAGRSAGDQSEAFTFLGNGFRWFEPDEGARIVFRIDAVGDGTLGPSESRSFVSQGLAAWTDVPGSSITLVAGGYGSATPFEGCPDANSVVFNDPFNEIDDPVDCRGVLAIGGFCTSAANREVNGKTFQRITRGKVTFANGWGGCRAWNPCNLAEVATHEIGHAIGIGHSLDKSATMAEHLHFDGRCAALGADDVRAVSFMYPGAQTQTPTPTITPSEPTATSTVAPTMTATRPATATRTLTPQPTARAPASATPADSAIPTTAATSTATASPTPPAVDGEVRVGDAEMLADGRVSIPVYVTSNQPLTRFGLALEYDNDALRPRQVRLGSWARIRRAVANGYVDTPGVVQVRFVSRRGLLSRARQRPLFHLIFERRSESASFAPVRLMR